MFNVIINRLKRCSLSAFELNVFSKIRDKFFIGNKYSEPDILIEGVLRTPKSMIEKIVISQYLIDNKKAKGASVYFKHSYLKSNPHYELMKKVGVTYFHSIESIFIFFSIIPVVSFSFFRDIKVIRLSFNMLDYKIKNIDIGDLLYDSIIRDSVGVYNFDNVSFLKKSIFLFQAIYLYYASEYIWNKGRYKYLVISHKTYLRYGIMFRIALDSGAMVVLKDNNVFKIYSENVNRFEHFLKPSEKQLYDFIGDGKKIKKSLDYLQDRFSGALTQMDAVNAFKNKKNYSRNELNDLLLLNEEKPLAIVMAHAISDSPHSSEYLHFDDYYQWIKETLICCNSNSEINTVVKSHPSSYFWGEKGVVEEIISEYQLENIKVLPSDFNTSCFCHCADIIITAQGTVALESVHFGIPAITCGGGYYSYLGAVEETENRNAYINDLNSLNILSIDAARDRITGEHKTKSAMILYLASYNQCYSSLVNSDNILPNQDFNTEKNNLWLGVSNNIMSYSISSDPLYIRCESIL
ncbi:hypothetical protein [Vibrio sp. F13]|uniref:capsular polysaccharide export protein, LipB/KpsS family n=3 Tax=unclassified Vibrio TaxID=2614977 RepID=UPI0010BDCCB7|nr:hypothetical protein [Vibrio sp. F13]TKF48034.1 hypothetical protein FCV49_06390 [Vibrio sp. F13]